MAADIVFISVASMIFGSVAAIAQRNIKRLMAYSSIGHVGYALIGLAAGTAAGIRGILVYLAIYLVMTVGTWAVVLCMRRQGRALEEIGDLSGLSRTHPSLALALAIFMFSLAGLPPTAGFFGKLYIFLAAIDAKLTGLAVIGVVTQRGRRVLLFPCRKVMYFDDPVGSFDAPFASELKGLLVVTAFGDPAFLPAARPGHRQRRSRRCVALCAMTMSAPLLPAAYRLILCETVGSTNDEAKELARAGALEGTHRLRITADGRTRPARPHLVVATRQSLCFAHLAPGLHARGRGAARLCRRFGVGESLSELAPTLSPIAYKWPNDVLAGGRKIAGILPRIRNRGEWEFWRF